MRLLVSAIVALFFVVACGSMPSKKLEKLQKTPVEKIHKSPTEIIILHPVTLILEDKPLFFSLDDDDWALNLSGTIVPAETFKMNTKGSKTPYLIISGFFHNVAYGKNGVVIGKIFVFDSKGRETKVPMVQMGEEPNCGLFRCMKVAYSIKDLKAGKYSIVVIPHVVDPDKPFKVNEVNNTSYTPATGMISTSANIPVYADYFGDLKAEFATKLPLDEKRPDVVTYK